jgi:hypothetical protein
MFRWVCGIRPGLEVSANFFLTTFLLPARSDNEMPCVNFPLLSRWKEKDFFLKTFLGCSIDAWILPGWHISQVTIRSMESLDETTFIFKYFRSWVPKLPYIL